MRRRILLLWFDACAIVGSVMLAAAVRFDGAVPLAEFLLIAQALPSIVGGKLLALWLFQCDRWSFRYAGASELRRLLAALSLGSLMGWAAVYFIGPQGASRTVLLLEPLFTLFFVGSIRFGLRVLPENKPIEFFEKTPGRPVLIVGAGEAGVMTLREIVGHPSSDMSVVGFIDDDPDKHGQWILGVRVIGGREEIPRAVEALGVVEIIIAIPSASGEVIRELIAACREVKVRIEVVPGLLSIITGKVAFEAIRKIRPEDLLGRETTEIGAATFGERLRGRKVLVTGAGGSIGREIVMQLADAGASLVLLDHSETAVYVVSRELADRHGRDFRFAAHIADVRNRARIGEILSREKPEFVYHAAACKHVVLMESNPTEAVSTNVFGTLNLIEAAENAGVRRFVLISTDKAVKPTSVMGATKRVAELVALARRSNTSVAAVRFGNVFGSSGSAIPLFLDQIERGGPVTVTHPHVVRYFMTVHEAVYLVIEASLLENGNALHVLEMGQPIRILDLARNLITLRGLRPEQDIPIVFTGLQPGEKLIEEVLTEGENVRPTAVTKVFRIDGAVPSSHLDLAPLRVALEAGDAGSLRSALSAIIGPEAAL